MRFLWINFHLLEVDGFSFVSTRVSSVDEFSTDIAQFPSTLTFCNDDNINTKDFGEPRKQWSVYEDESGNLGCLPICSKSFLSTVWLKFFSIFVTQHPCSVLSFHSQFLNFDIWIKLNYWMTLITFLSIGVPLMIVNHFFFVFVKLVYNVISNY